MSDEQGVRRGRVWWRGITALLGLALTFFAVAHSLEDFAYGVPEDRFGINPTLAAVFLAALFMAQGVVVVFAWRGWYLGYLGALVVGVGWFVAAALDHVGDVITDGFREGVTSDVLILGLMLSSLLLAASSGWVLFRRTEARVADEPPTLEEIAP